MKNYLKYLPIAGLVWLAACSPDNDLSNKGDDDFSGKIKPYSM
ncbi:MAG: hypothetical protein ACFCUU_07000 [Cyclobacteriaceae bacterium]